MNIARVLAGSVVYKGKIYVIGKLYIYPHCKPYPSAASLGALLQNREDPFGMLLNAASHHGLHFG